MSAISRLSVALGKQRISIDQPFLSNMAKGEAGSQRLLDSLRKAHSAGKIICPIHLEETIFESAALPKELRDRVFALQNLLSDGFAFHSLAQQARYATMQLILGEVMYPSIREVGLKIIDGTDFGALAKESRWAKEDYNDRVNKIPYPPSSYKVGMKGDEIYHHIAAERAMSFWRILEALRDKKTIMTGRDEWELAVVIGEYLAAIAVAPGDCDRLIHCVRYHEWESIPYLYVHARLGAQLELQSLSGYRNMNSNDQVDLSRLAVGLNDSRIVLCDSAMAGNIRQSKVLDILQGVRVYSMKEQDEAAEYIEKI